MEEENHRRDKIDLKNMDKKSLTCGCVPKQDRLTTYSVVCLIFTKAVTCERGAAPERMNRMSAIASPQGTVEATAADVPALGAIPAGLVEEGQIDILNMAAQCFMARGYASTSIDDVARKLGSTKGRIYHFFASKADLFFAVAEVGMQFNYAVVDPCVKMAAPAVDRLSHMAFAHCLSMIETQAYQHSVWQGVEIHVRGSTTPEQRERLNALIDSRHRYSELFRAVMEEAAADGTIVYDDLGIARQLMFMTLNSPIFWYKPRPGETAQDRRNIARQCTNFALAGLKAPPLGRAT